MNKISLAIEVATIAHKEQYRKLTNIPYIVHPYTVGMYLLKHGCSEDVVCAGILHDTLEDTEITLLDIEKQFGSEVARLVEECSEPFKEDVWEVRKQHTIDFLKTATKEVCMITCADKLHNIRSIRHDYQLIGEGVWEKFNRGRNQQAWYYKGIVNSLSKELSDEQLFLDLQKEISYIFD
ncbi:HD domain-containing protein [Litchfieldia salsa]|uniref:HD domain-containing protein n=1 Tax=Litchfieldia salsa TaxID=930152 RepID=A0A1H0TB43_9BACI|nr:HD domain-containing protein [Litchfieldia salsa]SDP51247.1 HD domain-containing protein [Litchfieldia salsa]